MPWEKRNNKVYYYRKQRFGDKVKSTYIGSESDELAQLIARLDILFRITDEQAALEQALSEPPIKSKQAGKTTKRRHPPAAASGSSTSKPS